MGDYQCFWGLFSIEGHCAPHLPLVLTLCAAADHNMAFGDAGRIISSPSSGAAAVYG